MENRAGYALNVKHEGIVSMAEKVSIDKPWPNVSQPNVVASHPCHLF